MPLHNPTLPYPAFAQPYPTRSHAETDCHVSLLVVTDHVEQAPSSPPQQPRAVDPCQACLPPENTQGAENAQDVHATQKEQNTQGAKKFAQQPAQ